MPNQNYRLYVFDALSGKLRVSAESFMTIGAGETSTFRVEMQVRTGGTFAMRGDVCRFFPHGFVQDYCINGMHPGRDVRIHPGALYLMTLAGACFLCWFGTEEGMPDFRAYDTSKWYVYDLSEKTWSEAYALPDLCRLDPPMDPESLVAFEGMQHCAFPAKDIVEVSRFAGTLRRFLDTEAEEKETARQALPLHCPFCWGAFSAGDVLAISSQPQLKGDPLLGEGAMRRFKPTAFNNQGLPLDEGGIPCRGTACPHCHSKLPSFYAELRPHVISLAGVRGSGKTYYLTTLLNEASRVFSRDFSAAFRDIAPDLNATLNRRRQLLSSATSPEQAYLKPTQHEPPQYKRIWKNGNFSDLPVPFLHSISRQSESCSILTYDNAGSDFEGEAQEDAELVTGHYDIAAAVFFLFDPTQSVSFNRVLAEGGTGTGPDATAQQLSVLNCLEIQLRLRFNCPAPAKLPLPLAFIIGKKDVWQELLGPEPLLPISNQGRLLPACIQTNSNRLRRLLFSISPQLCLSAEALTDNVCYFAVSSFGRKPVSFEDPETGELHFAPESGSTRPEHVEDPLLWVLSRLEPNLIPKNT